MKQPTFLLIGINGVYNYGCEAIVRGTEMILRREYPDAEVIYASRRLVDDAKRLDGCRVSIVERPSRGRYSATNICRKMLSIAGIHWDPRSDSLGLLRNVDAVLSIGGDLYTLDASGGYSFSLPRFGHAVRGRGIPYILWGASVGPFSQNPQAEKAYARHLREVSFVSARELETARYLTELGVGDRVVLCADPAYVVASDIQADGRRRRGKFTIGVNLSPLSAAYSRYSRQEFIHRQARCLKDLMHACTARIILIPHVVCAFNEASDDTRYLRRVQEAMGPDCRDDVSLVEGDPGFVGTKRELAACDIVIAARMHCAINALTARVPTILIAYSQKAIGMAEYVYGNRDWVVGVDSVVQGRVLQNAVERVRGQTAQICRFLDDRMRQIRQDAYCATERLKAIL